MRKDDAMLEPAIRFAISFLLIMLLVYVWASKRNLLKNRPLTPQEYLWKLKCITGKSEYEIFHIAAKEKGWPGYQVESHFKRYLHDQKIPVYVLEFLDDGKVYIDAYRPKRGYFFDKRVMLFFSLFALLIIGGSFVFCLYIYPRIYVFDTLPNPAIVATIKANPVFASAFINRAVSYGDNGQIAKACHYLQLACDSGYCEKYDKKKVEGVCQ